jgi:hypothetical protein
MQRSTDLYLQSILSLDGEVKPVMNYLRHGASRHPLLHKAKSVVACKQLPDDSAPKLHTPARSPAAWRLVFPNQARLGFATFNNGRLIMHDALCTGEGRGERGEGTSRL